jgi:rhodanese-related sulfurtransferase
VYIYLLSIAFCLWGSPAYGEGIKNLTAPEVKSMIDRGDSILVHVLSELEYDIQHVTGSINIPVIEMETTEKLPRNKNIPLIFYCMGSR